MKKLTENQEKWLQALESGKYQRTYGVLKRLNDYEPPSFCCLGVACDISGLGIWNPQHGTYASYELANGECSQSMLTNTLTDYLGVLADNAPIKAGYVSEFFSAMREAGYEKFQHWNTLTQYNDSGATFAQIAQAVRKLPEAIFI